MRTGTRLGHYEILSAIGKGGMGEVYRAKDTKLGREVAIKILPEALAHDPVQRVRFEREAKVLAALNHPNIATLYGIEDRALVMELVEGETLSARLRKGPLPMGTVLRFAGQMAEALTAAHAKGIVHRDLKPGNVMITNSGIKVLDFGLAKFSGQATHNLDSIETATMSDQIVGTLQYMAPEQLEGKECDERTDIFALGLVTYEMATAKRVFSGEIHATIVSEVLRCQEPSMVGLPPSFARAIRICLSKDPDERWQTAREFRIALGWTEESDTPNEAKPASTARRNRERYAWIAAVVLLLAVMADTRFFRAPADTSPISFPVPPPENGRFQPLTVGSAAGVGLAISPDGRRLAFLATVAGQTELWIRSVDSVSAHRLAGTGGASNYPFWSPDSRSIAFFADGKLKRIEANGGPPRDVCDAPATAWSGAWGPSGVILFSALGSGIYRVAAEGGEISSLTKVDPTKEREHISPRFLPDGRRFLYLATDNNFRNRVYVGSVDSGESKLLTQLNSLMEYAPPGYLLYVREGTLLAQRFNARDLALQGDAIPIGERLQYSSVLGLAAFSVSATVLAYQAGENTSRLVWLNRDGGEIGTLGQPENYDLSPHRFSPDGRRVVVGILDPRAIASDLHLFDVARGASTRFTATPSNEISPVWSPDGRRVAFSSDRGAPPFLHVKALNSSGDGEALLPPGNVSWPLDWSPDDRFLLYVRRDPVTNADLWKLPMQGDRKPEVFLNTRFNETDARFSPDGHWVVYVSDESGRPEVYVRPFLEPGEGRRISSAGGSQPRWRHDGKELFYVERDKLMSVTAKPGRNLETGAPSMLFKIGSASINDYDVSPDGQKFLFNSAVEGPTNIPIKVVVNWTAGLKR